ncbi:subclass B3 metallo-beta-lactamase [Erythrobacter sp. GH1-10]|uniref:subclass B3 metallo-beta-lactamase n=1 Tax=Erythrobacter sp. GH1-10 TaxID=3349334 RepID=UPI003877DFAF
MGRGPIWLHEQCEDWDDWDKPASPFPIYGNTYYVGTCGIAAVLVTGEDGHVLIDSGTEGGAEIVLTNIRTLGFDPGDVKLLLNSHEHFDHVGGMARMQAATGAEVVSSEIGVYVMTSGKDHPDDPQAGMHEPMARITRGQPFDHGTAPALLERFGMTPLVTPGHTPGAMSWSWVSCQGADCRTIVYADSMSPVSSDAYRFSDHPDYVAAYRGGIARIAAAECDILLTPHPSASKMVERSATGSFEGGVSCEDYAAAVGRRLDNRLAKEAAE